MFSNKIVFAGALASATVGGAIVGLFNVKGTAYVPAVLAPFMANEGKGPAFAVAMIAAMGCAFAITMAANVLERKKWKNSSEKSLKKLKNLLTTRGPTL